MHQSLACSLTHRRASHSSLGCPASPGVHRTVEEPRQEAGSRAGSSAGSSAAVSRRTFRTPSAAMAFSLHRG